MVEVQSLLDRPLFFESHRLSVFKPRGTDVNVVLDLMIHDIDIILSLVQQDIRELRASGYPVLTDEVDIANARLEFANGCVANVTASRVSQKAMRKMRIFQHDAYFSVDFPTSSIDIARRNGAERDEQGFPRISVEERKTAEKSDAILAEIRAFLDCVRTGATPAGDRPRRPAGARGRARDQPRHRPQRGAPGLDGAAALANTLRLHSPSPKAPAHVHSDARSQGRVRAVPRRTAAASRGDAGVDPVHPRPERAGAGERGGRARRRRAARSAARPAPTRCTWRCARSASARATR